MPYGPLKDLHLRTDLRDGVDLMVPRGDAWDQVAQRLRSILAAVVGSAVEDAAADAPVLDRLRQRHCVVLGHAFSNPAVMTLYRRQFAFSDDHYPGAGGYAVRTVHNPLNCGHNVLLLAAADPTGADAALDAFESLLSEHGPSLPYINCFSSPLAASLLPDIKPADFRTRFERAFEENALRGPIEQGVDFGLLHHLTADDSCAAMFRDVLFFYQDLVQGRFGGEWCFEHMLFIYAWTWRLFYVWDLIEESPAFTDADRQRMTDLLWDLAHYVADLPYFAGDEPALEIRQNHSTFAALSMSFAAGYFRAYYGVREFDRQVERCGRIFDGQAECYKPNDDGGGSGYCWIVPSHQLVFDLRQDVERFIRGDHLRQLADYAVLITDNLGSIVEFGDVGTYSARRQASTWMVDVLAQAASHYHEGGYLWALRWLGGSPMPGCYWRELPERPPEWMTGLRVAPLEEPLYAWAQRHGSGPNARGGPQYELVAREKAFDKLSLRSGFGEDDFYLLLDGTSTYAHGHDDGNCIERLTWKGRMWLAETDYIWRRPRFHSTLVSICDGVSHYPPPLAALEWAREYPTATVTRTSMTSYNGVSWTRDLVWVDERFLLVIDTAELLQDADYDLRCLWRTLGAVHLEDGDLTVEQEGVYFRILDGDGAPRSSFVEEPRVAGQDPYAAYPHADGPVRILSASLSLRGRPGQRERFCSLMVAGTAEDVAGWRIHRVGEARVHVSHGGEAWLVGLDGPAGQDTACEDVFVFGPQGLATDSICEDARASSRSPDASDATRPEGWRTSCRFTEEQLAGLRRACAQPVAWEPQEREPKRSLVRRPQRLVGAAAAPAADLDTGWSIRLQGAASCLGGSALGTACGTASGDVAWVDSDGEERWRANTGAEVRAVCLCELDGQPCLLAGGRDDRVTCFDKDGQTRWQRSFERSHKRAQCVNAIRAADLRGEGQIDIVVATDGWLVWCLDAHGQELWQRQVEHHAARSLVIGDVDGDGTQEILVGTEYYTSNMLEADGSIRWTVRGGPGFNALAVHDLDGDGVAESLYGSLDGNLYAVDSTDGSIRWLVNLGDEVRCLHVRESNGTATLVAGSDCGQLAEINSLGQAVLRHDLGAAVCGMAAFGDRVLCLTAAGNVFVAAPHQAPVPLCRFGRGATCLRRSGRDAVVGMVDGMVSSLRLPEGSSL